ncbi:Nucleoporin interacting component Nup93/Nic96 [Penicillium longicatenatum]|uniref:Nucleoporin interacting component Nup93/Nic96 n=1 Tax=Penicillium longicatenatum TaxID=1561947 RepID=UPI002548CD62|nr:Nucleoporin interacting component Nup93/Nic96 [Penicillium longicatenatum]KAJ5631698.1 Nucleoporin interacting component Nup93/Nic96 [Penicillium longicatenatum]
MGSLFGGGGLGASTTPKPSLFGSTNTTSAFGNTTAAPAAPAAPAASAQPSSLFGQSQAQSQPQPQPPAQSSILGQTQQPAKNPQEQSQMSAQTTKPAFFNSLLERGKKRPLSATAQNGNFEDVPSLQLGLDDIRRKARELGTSGGKDSQQNSATTKAHYLLASSGIAPGRTLRDLRSLDPQASLATTREPDTFDPDNQRYLRNIQQRGRQVMIAESLSRAQRDFDSFLEEKVDMDWEEQRQNIFQHFGLAQKDGSHGASLKPTMRGGAFGRSARQSKQGGPAASRRSVFGRSGLDKSVIGTPGAGLTSRQLFEDPAERSEGLTAPSPDLRFLREKMGHYAEKVQELNLVRLQGRTYPVLHQFSEVELQTGGDAPRQLFDAYQALVNIVRESPSITGASDRDAVKERQYATDYLEESSKSRKAINLKKQILEGSRGFLERMFYTEVETLITKNPREAQLGGIPTVTNKIRAYIRLRAARKDLAPDGTELQMNGQDYCWILIFYLLRCGFVKEAAEYVSQDPGFRSLDHKFVTYMTTYAQDSRLSREMQQKINGEYQQRSRNAPDNTVDPYRMACYKIIGRCDLSRRRLDGVNQTVEDWMWLQFSLAREDDRAEEVAGDVFGLEDIQTDITEIGQRVFTKGQDAPGGYGTFFLLQILGGMFEQAVAYLGSYSPVTAVHFAIALAYYGLLRVSDFYASGEEILSFTVKQYPQINFGYLITQYTREFRTGYVEAAIDYFSLICLNADLPGSLGKSQAAVCHEALREFILETRDFAKLLGDIRADGTRITGIIEQRIELINLTDQDDFLKNITVQAAGVADDKGLITDAVLLYHLAENYDRVIDIINRALSESIAVELGGIMPKLQPLRPRVEQGQNGQSTDQSGATAPGSSLSLTTVDDPVVLGKNMILLYNSKPMYYDKIRPVNRDACGLLLCMMEAKIEVEAGRWAPALDAIDKLNVLPLQARGSMQFIRSTAQSFSALPEIISRNIGHVIMWCIACIGHERHRQTSGPYDTDMHQGFAEQLLGMAKDLMVFSGMVKYKLPPKVYEALARAGADIGAF